MSIVSPPFDAPLAFEYEAPRWTPSLFRVGDFLAGPAPEERWFLSGMLPDEGLFMLAGHPKTGKSILALNIALVVADATQEAFLGAQVDRHGPVLVVAEEGPRSLFHRQLTAMTSARGIDPDSLDIDIALHQRMRIDIAEHMAWLDERVRTTRPALVILDPLANVHEVNENATKEIGPLLQVLAEMARTYEIAVLVIHHLPKPSRELPFASPSTMLRGATAIGGKSDGNFILRKTKKGSHHLLGDIRAGAPVSLSFDVDWTTYWPTEAEGEMPRSVADEVRAADHIRLLLEHIDEHGSITGSRAKDLLRVSPGTARSRLDAAVEQGLIDKTREGRADVWRPTIKQSVAL